MQEFDAIVVGGGPAGLAAACLLAQSRVGTALIARQAPPQDWRTVALMQPSINLLRTFAVWPDPLQQDSAPLQKLRIVDDTGGRFKAADLIFCASELKAAEFGWNIPLMSLIPALSQAARRLSVTVFAGEALRFGSDSTGCSLETSAGSIRARVALAADGRNSLLREAVGIGARSWQYDQVAMATSFSHSAAHDLVSTEYHRPAGPFTTVPLPDRRSSLVWMERPPRMAELSALSDAELASEIQLASHGELGRVDGVGPRQIFPMQGMSAEAFAKDRVLLIGEAAHVFPPIGAQGLNMSLRDAAHAAQLIGDAVAVGEDPGSKNVLHDFEVARRSDVKPRQAIIDAMNRSLLSEFELFGVARAVGLDLLNSGGPLRKVIMQGGLGAGQSLPRAMRG
jgi:2-octaprenyl-6-methoxyphenol hydroxylase